jgi:hypothetical protein
MSAERIVLRIYGDFSRKMTKEAGYLVFFSKNDLSKLAFKE